VIEAVYNSNERFLDAERQQLGVDHQEVGSLVMANWKLAPALHEAVALHHTPAQATIAPALCATVSLANSMCVRAGIGPERRPDLDLASLDAAEMLRMEAPALEAVIAQVTARLAEEKAVFNL
jgi:HD-like signal output (HDOD) protein